MPKKPKQVPSYLLHKKTGHARCYINGREVFLGRYNSAESLEKYRRLLAEVAASDVPNIDPAEARDGLTIVQLLSGYYDYAVGYFGVRSKTMETIRSVGKPLREMYGTTLAADFGPRKLKVLRGWMVQQGWRRVTINKRIAEVRRIFRWAVSEELVPPSVSHGLAAVDGLQKGRTEAPEQTAVQPVTETDIQATLLHLPAVVADMVQIQRLTGARPTEVCDMRPGDIDRTDTVWIYTPASHKGSHRDKHRTICIGPKAPHILRPYLLPPADAYCFSPHESEQKRLEEQHARRRTYVSTGNRPGTNCKVRPKRKPRERYDKDSCRRCVTRACEKAGVPKWTPHQLRHSAATQIRRQFGLEAAQMALGHSRADVTQVYAERDLNKSLKMG